MGARCLAMNRGTLEGQPPVRLMPAANEDGPRPVRLVNLVRGNIVNLLLAIVLLAIAYVVLELFGRLRLRSAWPASPVPVRAASDRRGR